MDAFDFLVVGAGIAGASIACELAPFARVVVVEQEERAGYHTSGRSAAMYIESYGAPPVRRLTCASRAFFDRPPDGFSDYPLLGLRGALTIASAEQSAAMDALISAVSLTGGAFREIGEADARSLVPILREGAAVRALLEPDSADIDVDALHQGYIRLARARGVEFRMDARLATLEWTGRVWRAALADSESIEAGVVIDAAGAWADDVAELAGAAPLGLSPKRRTVVLLDPPNGLDIARWPTVLDVDEQFYFKPQAGFLLASPGDETPSPPTDAAADELDIAICIDRIQRVADLPVKRVARAWAGLRTFAPDHVQAFGPDPAIPGFFWFAGQGGYGMQTAPAAARMGAALALGNAVPPDLADAGLSAADFSPARLANARS